MSVDKNLGEAQRWLSTAADDVAAARVLSERRMYAHACFNAQQAGEKAIKAVWFFLGEDPWGHSVSKLISELPEVSARDALVPLLEDAAFLDKHYIPTRYPNGLPDLKPSEAYFESDAERCIGAAEKLIAAARTCLGE